VGVGVGVGIVLIGVIKFCSSRILFTDITALYHQCGDEHRHNSIFKHDGFPWEVYAERRSLGKSRPKTFLVRLVAPSYEE